MENKKSKYLKYAIGEIVLVVIGILIALQINNWNENKKDKAFEFKMLMEIKIALQGDIAHTERMIRRMDKLDSTANVMAKHIVEKSIFEDSLYLHRSGSRHYFLTTGISNQYNLGPYQALKSSGLEKVSNDSLRNFLVYFYDFEFPRRKLLINWADRDYEEQVKKLKSFLSYSKVISHDNHYDYIRKYPESLFKNNEFATLLGEIHSRARNVRNRFYGVLPLLEKLIAHIESEIEND